MRNVFLYLYTESILLAIPSRFQMCILLVYAFSHEVYFLYTFSVPNYYYKKYTSVVYFLYTQCSILPIQMLYTKSIVDFDKGSFPWAKVHSVTKANCCDVIHSTNENLIKSHSERKLLQAT